MHCPSLDENDAEAAIRPAARFVRTVAFVSLHQELRRSTVPSTPHRASIATAAARVRNNRGS